MPMRQSIDTTMCRALLVDVVLRVAPTGGDEYGAVGVLLAQQDVGATGGQDVLVRVAPPLRRLAVDVRATVDLHVEGHDP